MTLVEKFMESYDKGEKRILANFKSYINDLCDEVNDFKNDKDGLFFTQLGDVFKLKGRALDELADEGLQPEEMWETLIHSSGSGKYGIEFEDYVDVLGYDHYELTIRPKAKYMNDIDTIFRR